MKHRPAVLLCVLVVLLCVSIGRRAELRRDPVSSAAQVASEHERPRDSSALPTGATAGRVDFRTRSAIRSLAARAGDPSAPGDRLVPVSDRGELDVFIRGEVSAAQLERAGARVRTVLPGLFTAYVPPAALDRVAAVPGVASVRLAAIAEAELSLSVPTTGAPLLRGPGPGFAGLNGRGVLVGSVDTGVDYHHGDFRDSTGATRFAGIWDQIAPGTGDAAFGYGRMWSAAEIDAGSCTEADSVGHGTHVLGIAAGDGSQTGGGVPAFTHVGLAPCADLALVKTNFSTAGILDGVKWLFDLAASRGENAVVNLSLGTQYGPHDGSSDFEQGLASLTGPGRIIVKSAGNDRGTARHAETLATVAGATISLSVSGSAVGRTFAIDGYYDATERMRVRITTPGGTVIGPVALGAEDAAYPGVSTANGIVYLANDSLATGRRNVYVEVNNPLASQSMSGTWSIVFLADRLGAVNGLVDLWRFYSSSGLAANFVTGNQPARELISEPGNAADVLTVGAYVTRSSWTACSGASSSFAATPAVGALSTFSSPGPTRDGRPKPDLAAPGESIVSTTSFDIPVSCTAANVPSVYADDAMNHTAMRGTSMAAPHVTGAVALLLQKRGALTPAEAKAYLAANARRDAFTGATAGNDWGAGKLALGDLLDPVVSSFVTEPSTDVIVDGTLTLEWSSHDSLGSVVSVDLMLSRTGPQGAFETIASGVANSGRYDWAVTGPPTGEGQAVVRVVAHDSNGNTGSAESVSGFTIHSPLSVGATAPLFALGPPRPNPAVEPVRVAFSLARASRVRLTIEDVAGRRIATLANGTFAAGRHEARWDLSRRADRVPAGLYFIAYDTPVGRITRRVVVAR